MGALGPTHIAIVLVVFLLVFAKRLPEVGRAVGSTLREFKKGSEGLAESRTETPGQTSAPQLPAAGSTNTRP